MFSNRSYPVCRSMLSYSILSFFLLLFPKDRNFTLEKNQDLFSSSLTFCWLKWDPKIESAWPFVTSKQQHFSNEEKVKWFNYVLYVPSFLGSSIDDVTHTYFSFQCLPFMYNFSALLRMWRHLLTIPSI